MGAKEWAKDRIDINSNFLIFWATIFLTSFIGLIELLPEVKPLKEIKSKKYFFLISLLYFALVVLMSVSIHSCIRIVRENVMFTRDGYLGEEYSNFTLEHPSLTDSFVTKEGHLFKNMELVSVVPIIFFLGLYLEKTDITRLRDTMDPKSKKPEDKLPLNKNTQINDNKKSTGEPSLDPHTCSEDPNENWIELHRHFTQSWEFRSTRTWETIKSNIVLSSALTSLTIYSIVYIYTSEFFWTTDLLTTYMILGVRIIPILIPMLLFFVNLMFYRNFRRSCERVYEILSIVIKIEEKLGLYSVRSSRELIYNDKWYVPDDWKNLSSCSSEQYVAKMMVEKNRFYKSMVWLFWVFGAISVLLFVSEIILFL